MLRLFLDNLWKWKCGIKEIDTTVGGSGMYNDLYESEWSNSFEALMRNRLVMGSFRYGKLGEKDKPKYDRVKDIVRRVGEYRRTGNCEYLVDIANLCMCEYVEGEHPYKHFNSKSNKIHTDIIKE